MAQKVRHYDVYNIRNWEGGKRRAEGGFTMMKDLGNMKAIETHGGVRMISGRNLTHLTEGKEMTTI